jgi:hypothetical protein
MKSNFKPKITALPLAEPPREIFPVAPLPDMAPLLIRNVSDHGGTQRPVAEMAQAPSADPVARLSVLDSDDGLLVTWDGVLRRAGAASSPPDTDLSVLPRVPPVEPA